MGENNVPQQEKEEITSRNLPEEPKRLGLFARLTAGLTGKGYNDGYNDALKETAQYRAKLEEEMARVEKTEAGFAEREESLNTREKKFFGKEYEAKSAAEERNRELDAREAEIKAKEDEIARRLAELAIKEKEAAEREEAAGVKEKTADEMIERFKEREGIDPEVPNSALERDEIIKATLVGIKETSEKLLKVTEATKDRELTPDEKVTLTHKKAELRAALLATVCAYRDSLPEIERIAFNINGKSCSTFLQEQAQKISAETTGKWVGGARISESALSIIDSTYKKVSQNLGMDAEYAYDGAAYTPFSGNMGLTDMRNAGINVFINCSNGKDVGLKLHGGLADLQRSTTDITTTTNLEEEINHAAKNVDDWEK